MVHRQVEFGPDQDEQLLYDLGFRQENHIFVTFGTSLRKPVVGKPREKLVTGLSPPPVRECMPMVIAASPQNFEIFFELQRRLDLLAPGCPSETNRMQLAEVEGKSRHGQSIHGLELN